jgi:hypothetical protein
MLGEAWLLALGPRSTHYSTYPAVDRMSSEGNTSFFFHSAVPLLLLIPPPFCTSSWVVRAGRNQHPACAPAAGAACPRGGPRSIGPRRSSASAAAPLEQMSYELFFCDKRQAICRESPIHWPAHSGNAQAQATHNALRLYGHRLPRLCACAYISTSAAGAPATPVASSQRLLRPHPRLHPRAAHAAGLACH